MKEKQFRSVLSFLRKTKRRETIAKGVTAYLPKLVAAAYLVAAAVLFIQRSPHAPRFVLVPLVSLAVVTVIRKVIDSPRPYESFDIEPLSPHGVGQSFPSRHTASAVVIAVGFWYLNPALGAFFSAAALAVAGSRVAAGLHFPKDVLAGAALSLMIGLAGFFLL